MFVLAIVVVAIAFVLVCFVVRDNALAKGDL